MDYKTRNRNPPGKIPAILVVMVCISIACFSTLPQISITRTGIGKTPTATGLPTATEVPASTATEISTPTTASYGAEAIPPTATLPQYRPITWMELASFLDADHTNWNTYVLGKYVCLDFAVDLVANAAKQNIKAWIVGVEFSSSEPDHAFTAFETTDRGIVFIEPQTDVPYIKPQVGQPLCDLWTGTDCMGTISSIEYLQCDHEHYCMKYDP